jgi:TRAP-type C4-dicarboxylate transport system substrate-binding protein
MPLNLRHALVAATIVGAVAQAAVAPAAAEPRKVSIAFVVPEEEILGQAMNMMAQYMNRSLPGSFDVAVYGGSSLFQQSQQIPAMQRGNLEIGFVNMFDVAPMIPEASILTAGYLVRDVDHHCTILNSDFGQGVMAQMAETMGIIPLGQAYIGKRTLVLRDAMDVQRPEDLANITMREVGNEAFQFLAEALGARPTPIAFSELYLALQTGTVDAFAGFATAMKSTKFHEVTEQLVRTEHLLSVDLIAVSKVFWDTLSDHEKQVVREAANVASLYANQNRARAEENAFDELVNELGMTVTTPDVEAFRKFMRDKYVASRFAEAWPEGLYDRLQQMPTQAGCTLNVSF